MTILLALLLAGAQPAAADAQTPASGAAPTASAADSDALFAVFEQVCLSGGETPAGFETAAWSDFPAALGFLNTYDAPGTFFRRAEPETWIARTRGEAHMMPGIETKCGIAARGIDAAATVERLKKRAKAERTSQIGEGAMTLIIGQGGVFDVTSREDGWVLVRTTEILIRADSVPGRYRKRKGKKD